MAKGCDSHRPDVVTQLTVADLQSLIYACHHAYGGSDMADKYSIPASFSSEQSVEGACVSSQPPFNVILKTPEQTRLT